MSYQMFLKSDQFIICGYDLEILPNKLSYQREKIWVWFAEKEAEIQGRKVSKDDAIPPQQLLSESQRDLESIEDDRHDMMVNLFHRRKTRTPMKIQSSCTTGSSYSRRGSGGGDDDGGTTTSFEH